MPVPMYYRLVLLFHHSSVAELQRIYAIVTDAAIKFPFYLAVISIYVSTISIFSRVSKKIIVLIKNLYTDIYSRSSIN